MQIELLPTLAVGISIFVPAITGFYAMGKLHGKVLQLATETENVKSKMQKLEDRTTKVERENSAIIQAIEDMNKSVDEFKDNSHDCFESLFERLDSLKTLVFAQKK